MTTKRFNTMDVEDVIDTLRVMRKQEVAGYTASDYFAHHHQHLQQMDCHLPLHTACASASPQSPVDVDCRYKMADWCYQVIDFCKFNRETVSIAMSYLDRFLSTSLGHEALQERGMFQLVAMTCLYTAIKVHEPQAVDPKTFATLSRGACTAEEIQAMESIALEALEWRMNPPTSIAFLHYFFELIPSDLMTANIRETIFDLARFQTELAVCEYDFVTVPASTVAFSSLTNATECIDEGMANYLRKFISCASSIDCESDSIHQAQQKLYEIITKRPGSLVTTSVSTQSFSHKPSEGHSSVHVSPRSIVGTCHHAND